MFYGRWLSLAYTYIFNITKCGALMQWTFFMTVYSKYKGYKVVVQRIWVMRIAYFNSSEFEPSMNKSYANDNWRFFSIIEQCRRVEITASFHLKRSILEYICWVSIESIKCNESGHKLLDLFKYKLITSIRLLKLPSRLILPPEKNVWKKNDKIRPMMT